MMPNRWQSVVLARRTVRTLHVANYYFIKVLDSLQAFLQMLLRIIRVDDYRNLILILHRHVLFVCKDNVKNEE